MANAMVNRVRPNASATPTNPMPNPGNAAEMTAAPQPPNTSHNVPRNSAKDLFESDMRLSSSLTTDATIRHMKRRGFLLTAMAGAAIGGTGCQYVPAATTTTSAAPGDFELDEVGIASLADGLQKGKWTSARLVELYLGRIEAIDRSDAIDRNGPTLNSVLALNPDAASTARQLDQERRAATCADRCMASRFWRRTTSKRAIRWPPPPVRWP